MAVPPPDEKANIWVAAGDGDLDRVRELVEQEFVSPNAKDPNSYTPMHAAASYGRIIVLEYLICAGGKVNILDDDGQTPLYLVEDIDTAKLLVKYGACINMTDFEGLSPVECLAESYPDIAEYLASQLPENPEYIPARLLESVVGGRLRMANENGPVADVVLPPADDTPPPRGWTDKFDISVAWCRWEDDEPEPRAARTEEPDRLSDERVNKRTRMGE